MLAYDYNGDYVEASKAIDFISDKCKQDPETKQEVFDYMWEMITGDRELSDELKEWFFFGPAKYMDPEEERLGHQIDHDYELWRDENVKAI